tara:strand:+ start:132 stop:365 length:234 start_codon:yes stop_codon:yes gene_type:complete
MAIVWATTTFISPTLTSMSFVNAAMSKRQIALPRIPDIVNKLSVKVERNQRFPTNDVMIDAYNIIRKTILAWIKTKY